MSCSDQAGNGPVVNMDTEVTIDTLAPAEVTITTPINGSSIGDNTPLFTGTGEPNATIDIIVDGLSIACVEANPPVVDSGGNWVCTPVVQMSVAVHTVNVIQTDRAGNVSDPEPLIFSIITPPLAPAPPPDLIDASDSGISGTDNITFDSTPTFSGNCNP